MRNMSVTIQRLKITSDFIKHDSFNIYLCIVFDDTLFPIHYKNQILSIFITYSLLEENVY